MGPFLLSSLGDPFSEVLLYDMIVGDHLKFHSPIVFTLLELIPTMF